MQPKQPENRDLPPRMIRRTKKLKGGKLWVGYYYDGRGKDGKRKEIPLGTDLDVAKLGWARLDASPVPKTLRKWDDVSGRYEKEIIPGKVPRTQKDNLLPSTQLRKAFSEAPIEAFTPQVLAQYRDKRSAKVWANRELSLFSHIFNIAREWGIVTAENPVKRVYKDREIPRDFYARVEVWNAVHGTAPPELHDAMDLAYLTAQRPSDVLIIRETDIQGGHLQIAQGKTSKKLRTMPDVDGSPTALGELVARLREQRRQRGVAGPYLITTPDGCRTTSSMPRIRFGEARPATAGAALEELNETLATAIRQFQFRDVRPKATSETADLGRASRLLGHTDKRITEAVYRHVGEIAEPTKQGRVAEMTWMLRKWSVSPCSGGETVQKCKSLG